MDAALIMKMVKVLLKERYTRGGLLIALLVIGVSMFFVSLSYLIGLSGMHVSNIELPSEYVLYISVFLVFYLFPSISMFSKAEADFVLTAPVDPLDVMISKILTAAITNISVMLAMTYWYPMIMAIAGRTYVVPEYLVEAVALGVIVSAISLLLGLKGGKIMILTIASYAAYAISTSILYPQLNIIYMVIKPNAYYMATIIIILLLSLASLKRNIKSISVNIYSLTLSRAPRRDSAKPSSYISFAGLGPTMAMLKSSLLSATLQLRINAGASSAYRLQRINALFIGLPISIGSAIAYLVLFTRMGIGRGGGFFIWFPAFYIGIFAFSFALAGISGERLWLSCMAMDCTSYFKKRMYVRSIIGLILASPWVIIYVLIYIVTGSFLSLLVAISLTSMMPSIASMSLMVAPWTGVRQNRFIGLEEYVPRVNPLGFLIGIISVILTSIYLVPPLLYAVDPITLPTIAISISLLIISLLMPKMLGSKNMVEKLFNKLIEEGFI